MPPKSNHCLFVALLISWILPVTAHAEDNYFLEIQTSVDYDSSSGTVTSTPEGEPTNLSESRTDVDVGVGLLLGETFEPTLELGYQGLARKVAEFEANDTTLSYGLGILFNMPIVTDSNRSRKKQHKDSDSADAKDDRNDLTRANWIPFLGFLVSSESSAEKRGATNVTEVEDGNLVTKLQIGLRWVVYEHVSMNFSLRASYQDAASKATDATPQGGSVRKLELEARLLGLSLFI